MAIEQSVNKPLKQVDFNIPRSVNCCVSGGGLSVKSNMTCNKCVKKSHIQKYCRSKGTGSCGNPPKKSANELPEWVTKKPVVSDTKDLATNTITHKNKKYMCCTYFNNNNGAWGFQLKDGHE